ncbi:hypothetical protein [Staphylococcus marylandisciuri]|nr:hypothetical protein [Staphylococcus marylandisciuri]
MSVSVVNPAIGTPLIGGPEQRIFMSPHLHYVLDLNIYGGVL